MWRFSIRELLALTLIVAGFTMSIRIFGWPNVLILVLHPAMIFVYVAVAIERRMKWKRKVRGSKLHGDSSP